MSIWELCDYQHGTESKMYELFRVCHNAFRTILIDAVNILKFVSNNIYLILPGRSLVLPVYIDGVFSMTELPKVKVWAVRTTYKLAWEEEPMYISTKALFKNSLEDIWREVVKPIDYPIPDSQYLFFMDDNGEIKQGVNFYGEGKDRKFMLLGDGGPLVRDVGAFILFTYLLDKVGLKKKIEEFTRMVLTNLSNIFMKRRVAATADMLKKLDYNFSQFLIAEETSDTHIIQTADSINDKIGVRLILR